MGAGADAAGHGWVRTDFLSIAGDAIGFGLSKGDEYPAPLQNYWWVRGQNDVQPNGSVDKHLGWDFSANPGEAIRCGPNGGHGDAVSDLHALHRRQTECRSSRGIRSTTPAC